MYAAQSPSFANGRCRFDDEDEEEDAVSLLLESLAMDDRAEVVIVAPCRLPIVVLAAVERCIRCVCAPPRGGGNSGHATTTTVDVGARAVSSNEDRAALRKRDDGILFINDVGGGNRWVVSKRLYVDRW